MFTITKEFHFSAAHQLTHLRPDHPCARLHGHNYVVEIELRALVLNESGFVVDYGELKSVQNYIDAYLDHQHLNTVLGSSMATTAEHLARHLFGIATERLRGFDGVDITAVRVRETPKTCAEYRP
jgi:6-pyruvoyltetrahydropterin/6-carboxytetrahydropterin synthase